MLINLPYAMIVQIGSLIIIWLENTAIRVIFENILFFGLGSYF
jgi:hypothetical protein